MKNHPLRMPALLLAAAAGLASACSQPSGTDETPSPTGEPTGSATVAPEVTATQAPSPTASHAPPTQTPTAIPTPTATVAPTPTAAPTPIPVYSANVRFTAGGVPHISADTLADASFGHGYVYAQNHACILADQILKVRSERAATFGPGEGGTNLDFDFGMLALGVYTNAEAGWPALPQDVKDLITGFAAGYNHYVRSTAPADYPGYCAGASWVKPITHMDLAAYYTAMALMASGQAVVPGISRAQPPGGNGPGQPLLSLEDMNLRKTGIGSNGWALGGDKTASGHGMLMANPHFPWEGELKFFEAHITVPGKINAYGAALMGSPVPNIGFNEHVAWTHTFSWAARGSFYQLRLDPTNPTRYRYGNGFRDMTAQTFTINVKGDDDQISPLERTLYRTHWGPIIATEEFGWTPVSALSFRDVNDGNTRLIEHFAKMAMANSLDDFIAVHEDVHAIPWVHTLVTTPDGRAVYMDSSRVPHLSDETKARWQANLEAGDPLTVAAYQLGVPLLDGTSSADEWVTTRLGEYTIPLEDAPFLERRDFVFNSNDSHWLANPASPLEGFDLLYGHERSPRSPRTRMNMVFLTEEGDEGVTGTDGRFDLSELTTAMVNNRAMMAELLLEDVVARCDGVPFVFYERQQVDITEACQILSQWDGRLNLDSQGPIIWREALSAFTEEEREDGGRLFASPFNPDDPIHTPYGLYSPQTAQEPDPILQALGFAVLNLATAGIPLDAPLGDVQYSLKGETRLPVHGGSRLEGPTNMNYMDTSPITATSLEPPMEPGAIVNPGSGLSDEGYLINYGSSFMLALEYTDTGPQGKVVMTYSQSADPQSPHFNDQGPMFAEKQWRELRFSDEAIDADPELMSVVVSNGG